MFLRGARLRPPQTLVAGAGQDRAAYRAVLPEIDPGGRDRRHVALSRMFALAGLFSVM